MTLTARIAVALALTWASCGTFALAIEDEPHPNAQVPSLPGANVESLLSLAKERNPDYAAMRYEAIAADERVLPASALMNPRFKMELEDITKSGAQNPALFPSDVGSTRYTVSQDLPWIGKRALRREIAEQEADAARGRGRQVWSELAARIKTVFVQRFQIKATERLVKENLDLMLQLEKVMQVRYGSGLAAQQDITRIHVEHTGMRSELAALAGEWRQSQSRLNALLARPMDTPLAIPEKLRPLPEPSQLDFDVLSERLRKANPLMLVEAARVKSAEKVSELSRTNRYPDFTLGVNAIQRSGAVNEWGVMLEFNLPIQGDVLRSQEREAHAMQGAAQARQDAISNQVMAELSENLSALEAARQTEHLMTYSLMPQADLTWRAALAGYENGKADFATLLDAQRQIRQARLGQLKAQVDAQLRLAEIERLLGEVL